MMIVPSEEISKDRNSEKNLTTEKTFQTVFENAYFGMVLVGTDGCFIETNQAACDLFGYSRDELLTLTFKEITYPDDVGAGVELFSDLMSGKREYAKMEKRYIRKDGSVIWTLLSTSVVQNPSGAPRYLVTLFQDITDRKQVEFDLAKNEAFLEDLVASRTQSLSILVDVITVASSSLDLKDVLERSLSSVLDVMDCDMGAIHLLDEANRKVTLTSWQNVPEEILEEIDILPISKSLPGRILEKDGPLVVPDMRRDPDTVPAAKRILGERVYIGVPLKAKGKTVGVLVIIGQADRIFPQEEISLLEAIAQQIGVAVENARLYKQAEIFAISEERQRLAREIHDTLAQGLTGINIQLEAIESALEMNNRELALKRLNRTRNLANQSLAEARRSVWALRSQSLVDKKLSDALRDSVNGLTTETGLAVSVQVQDDLPPFPEELQSDLLRIVQEAVMNVVKHAQAENLTVKLDFNDHQIQLSIEDDGRGFQPGQIIKNRADIGGFGLISMEQRITRHGGQLQIHSTPQCGTTILVELKFFGKETING
jgi:PAS domain S-box-containing protein